MAGVPSARLQVWAVPSISTPWWDHTYAVSSCGLRWGCFGRDVGGRSLGSGTGSSIDADCLSQVNSEAGIIYGKTGVCHQAANRILYPARITAVGCNGYSVSIFRYGTYGKAIWSGLSRCYPSGTLSSSTPIGSGQPTPQSRNPSEKIGVDDATVSGGHMVSGSQQNSQLAELSAMVETALGYRIDQETIVALFAIQTDLQRADSISVARLEAGEITPDQYLDQVNANLQSAMNQSKALLGEQRFQAIFGEAGDHPEGLIHRYTFMERTIADA
jgi:hypothetical protein